MSARATLALLMMLGAVALFVALGVWAWQAMKTLPERATVERAATSASAELALTRIGRPNAARPGATGKDDPSVRYVDGNGIVSARVDGTLERLPAKAAYGPPPQPPREPIEHKLVVIESAGVIDARDHTIMLDHITAPKADRECTTTDGLTWPCGRRARTALRRLVRRRSIYCLDNDIQRTDAGEIHRADCTVGGQNMALWLVERGWAVPTQDAPDTFRTAHESAQNLKVGLFHPSPR